MTNKTLGGLAQLARASALHAEGHRFDSDILHKTSYKVLAASYKPGAKRVLLKLDDVT